jgi:hypothetical protein
MAGNVNEWLRPPRCLLWLQNRQILMQELIDPIDV